MQTLAKRIIIGLITVFLMITVRKTTAESFTATMQQNQSSRELDNRAKLRLVNPTSSDVIYVRGSPTYQSLSGTGADPFYISWGSTGSVTVPANSHVDVSLRLSFFSVPSAQTYQWTNRPVTLGGTVSGVQKNATFNIDCTQVIQTGSISGGQIQLAPSDPIVATFPVATPNPIGRVTVIADAAAIGARFFGLSGSEAAVTLVSGSNVLVNITNPASVADGAVYKVLHAAGGPVIGTGTVAKDQFGNFDLTITAVGLPVSGSVSVIGQVGLAGPGRLKMENVTGSPFTLTFDSTSDVIYTKTFPDPAIVPDQTACQVDWQNSQGLWQRVGTGLVVKQAGSFSLVITCKGDDMPEDPAPNDGVFKLDVVSFDLGSKYLQLEIDGVLFSAAPSFIGGDAAEGIHSRHVVTLDTAVVQNLAGKNYKWVVTGELNGQAVTRHVIASGTVPETSLMTIVNNEAAAISTGFEVEASVTLGRQYEQGPDDPPPPPPNDYDPEAEPPTDETPEEQEKREQKKDDYEMTRKAVSDALAETLGTDSTPGPRGEAPSDAEGVKVAADVSAAGGKFDAASKTLSGAGTGAIAPPANFTGSASGLSLNFPVFGTAYLDLSKFDPWPGLVRAVLLGWFGWLATVGGLRIFRNSHAQ